MSYFIQWLGDGGSALVVLSLAVVIGLALGAIRVRGIRLGVAAVLFTGLMFGQFGWSISPDVLRFTRDFSLVLFIYTIGLQVGPGFFSSFRDEGVKLNLLALAIVLIGALMTAGIVNGAGLKRESASGLFAGAFTTTPGFAAGNEALRAAAPDRADAAAKIAGQSFTATYPFGLIGPILAVLLLRKVLRINMPAEVAGLTEQLRARRPPRVYRDIEIIEAAFAGRPVGQIGLLRERGIILSRLLRGGAVSVPSGAVELAVGDIVRAVGTESALDELTRAAGRTSAQDLDQVAGEVSRANLVVTRKRVLGKSLRELNLRARTGANIIRVIRAGTEVEPTPDLKLHFGDHLTIVSPSAALKEVELELGNSPDMLNRAELIPIFLGIVLGVIVGSIPLAMPGLKSGMKIGLAGGPMIVAILLSRLGNVGSVVWYMPDSAALLLRDFGMAVFLACVGLQSGDHFIQHLMESGLVVALWGAAITMLPPFLVCLAARIFLRMNFVTISGLVAGGMTSSPTLLFADEMTGSKAPALTYAAVYPLAMLAPIFCSQMLAILLVH